MIVFQMGGNYNSIYPKLVAEKFESKKDTKVLQEVMIGVRKRGEGAS